MAIEYIYTFKNNNPYISIGYYFDQQNKLYFICTENHYIYWNEYTNEVQISSCPESNDRYDNLYVKLQFKQSWIDSFKNEDKINKFVNMCRKLIILT